ncbi:LysR family transcriptional regulator [Robbsia sp. Bb-Pol-6]|uniref:LysR family transcriptional regulator n=1 Tax=Robbsia betulipollinis TaxID=2981849 RepID=A0ABT3ZGU6_9BURK|nr:LysR family transcriptional regulator [Robbsia betulipollinis]MCY0385749.1 LysR family transcriptional regulator [Robbsia betulipollinis]
MNIRFLETFVWLARLRNFRLTAEQLHTTQAAVSSRIAALERSFGTRLFDRTARAATLTAAGQRLLEYAERIVRLDVQMRHAIHDDDGGGTLLRLGVIESIVHSWFPRLMARIRERYPRLELEVTSDTTIDLGRLLRGGAVDLILHTETLAGENLENIPLAEFPMRWVASPALGLGARPVDLLQLAEWPIVSFSRHSAPHAHLRELLTTSGEHPARVSCVSSVAAMIRLVVDGFGVAVLPPAIIQRELDEQALEVLDVVPHFPSLPLVASVRADSHPFTGNIVELAVQASHDFATTLMPAAAPRRPSR